MTDSLVTFVPQLANRRVVVVGDVILDEYLIGRANRLSREAPIPVLEYERRDHIPGGAANPSANIAALGSTAIQIGVVGNDPEADVLRSILQARRIDPSGLVIDPSRPTTTKTRIMAHMGLRFPQQVARIDRLARHAIDGDVEKLVLAKLAECAPQTDAIMLSDYLSGMLTQPIIERALAVAREHNILITADAQGQLDKYREFDLVKCNADEAERFIGRQLHTNDEFAKSGREMVRQLNLRGAMLLTRGADGLTVVMASGNVCHIPAVHVEDVYDTVGAGDTVLAVVTLALAAGTSYPDAAAIANAAAGIVIRKVGNYAPTPAELIEALNQP